ncbi:unnamed protein product [Gulo gulo]|uniref:Uncharacterized protein n=1 Tax=Gulo gulo TaxID=48420 RepID=A0A9X9MB56_GULGU|nr:unnamed protein product [Gulo gulo]
MASQPAVSVGHLPADLGLDPTALWRLPHLAPPPPGPPCPGTCLLFVLSGGVVLGTPPGLNPGLVLPRVLEAGAELVCGAVCGVHILLVGLFCQHDVALFRGRVHGQRWAKP